MKKQLLLKQFEYSIPYSALVAAGVKSNHFFAEHLPLMKVTVDFENGKLKLDGDWRFMLAANKHNEASRFGCDRDRVKIETAIYPACVINLNDPYSNGLMFPLEGNINDGNSLSTASGLLILDNVTAGNGLMSNQWNTSFYIYDAAYNDCEIKFQLPVYIVEITPGLN